MILQQQASAKIYQFPVGGRAGLSDAQRPAASQATIPRGSMLGAGESWYHAEAVQAAQQAASV